MLTSTAHRLLYGARRLLGTDKGSGRTVPVCDVALDMPDQGRHGVERAAPDRLAGEDAEPGLDHVEPGGTLRSEVEVDLRMPSEPCLHRGRRMRGRVVEDDVQGTPTIAAGHAFDEAQEIGACVLRRALAHHAAAPGLQGGVQARQALSAGVVGLAGRRYPAVRARPA